MDTRKEILLSALREKDEPIRKLAADAAGDVNLMGAIIDAARADVTMGEMCDTLRQVWGVWRETPVF